MAAVTFFAKIGCKTNGKQFQLLTASGHEVERRDILGEPWTRERLTSFFQDLPVAEWFNKASPRVKSGEIDAAAISADAALTAMLADPLLIRRPLVEAAGQKIVGFDQDRLRALIGLNQPEEELPNGCSHNHNHGDHAEGACAGHTPGQCAH